MKRKKLWDVVAYASVPGDRHSRKVYRYVVFADTANTARRMVAPQFLTDGPFAKPRKDPVVWTGVYKEAKPEERRA